MAMIDRNFTFATNGTVTANDLHNLIDSATIYQDLITGQQPITSVGTNYELLIADGTNPNAAPNAVTVYDLFEDALTAGTYSNANISAALTYGTATGTRLVSANATITTGTITTGVIPTLTSSTATFGTTTSTAATITSGTITNLASTTGTIATLNSTTGTIATLNSTTGTIATLNSTTGTIPTLVATTLITTGAGTAAAPAIVPTGDTNTGIFFPAADTIAFAEGGTEGMRIDSSGNVGIGTASPSGPLHIRGAAGRFAFPATSGATQSNGLTLRLNDASDDNAILDIGGNSTSGYWLQAANNANLATNYPLLLNPNGGNVGIGTTSPAYKLDVSGDIGVGAGNKFTTVSGNDLNLDAPTTRSIFLKIAGSTKATIDSSGGVTIAGLAGSGSRAVNASAAGLLSAASDASLKEEVVGAHIAGLDEILQIHPKMYRWKDDIANRGENASVELGFIANDVAPIIPSAAPLGNDGLYGFYDRSITAALVKAVQELKLENDSLKARITALEAK